MTKTTYPQPTHYVEHEGGQYVNWPTGVYTSTPFCYPNGMGNTKQVVLPDLKYHAVFYADGRVWDTVNGWRPGTTKIIDVAEEHQLARAYDALADIGCEFPARLILQDLHRRLTALEERATETERRELEEILQSGGYGPCNSKPSGCGT